MRRSCGTAEAVASGLAVLILASCAPPPTNEGSDVAAESAQAVMTPEQAVMADPVRRGQYLVQVGSCNDCHTPWVFDESLGMPRPDLSRLLSGHPEGGPDPEGTPGPHDMGLIGPTFTSFALPFGIVYSLNLTPDVDTGIGSWTEEMFIDIFRKGRHLGGDGRGVMPPMPWFWIRNLTDDDLRAVFAYLNSLPPVRNAVPEPKIPEEALWQLRDAFDQFAADLPQQEWAARKPPAESSEGN